MSSVVSGGRLLPRLLVVHFVDLITAASFFLFVRALGSAFGVEAVGVYAVVRRVLGVAIPLISLGLNESLAYSVASHRNCPWLAAGILGAAGAVLALSTALVALVHIFDRDAAMILFGTDVFRTHALAGTLLLVCTAFAAMIGSIARGFDDFSAYAWLQVFGLALAPFIALGIESESFVNMLFMMSAVTGIVALGTCWKIAIYFEYPRRSTLVFGVRQLVVTSASRLPGVVLIGFVPLLIVLAAKEMLGLERTGVLAVAISLAIALGGIASAFGISALPSFVRQWQARNTARLTSVMGLAIAATISLMAYGAGLFYAAAGPLATFVFPAGLNAVAVFQQAAPVIPLVGLTAILRQVLDVVSPKALNTRIQVVSCLVTTAACAASLAAFPTLRHEATFMATLAASHIVVIALSFWFAMRAGVELGASSREIAKSLLAALLPAAGVVIAADNTSGGALLAAGAVSAIVFAALLRVLRVQWLAAALEAVAAVIRKA